MIDKTIREEESAKERKKDTEREDGENNQIKKNECTKTYTQRIVRAARNRSLAHNDTGMPAPLRGTQSI